MTEVVRLASDSRHHIAKGKIPYHKQAQRGSVKLDHYPTLCSHAHSQKTPHRADSPAHQPTAVGLAGLVDEARQKSALAGRRISAGNPVRSVAVALGGGVIKQRIARPGAGKSKGYRSIVLYKQGERAFFVYGFPKSDLDNIRDDEEEQFKKAAKLILALTDEQIRQLIENGQFEEVMKDG